MSENRASRQGVKVVVLYSSLSGNTRAMAEHVAAGVRLVPGATARLMDAASPEMETLEKADGIAVGSPNYYSYPSGLVKHFFDLAFQNAAFKGKPYVAFSTHGGGGGVSAILDRLAKSLGMKRVGEGLDILGAPEGDQVKACRKLGQALATASA
jgi:NAD(P)H dehydrogenase (quinone)